MLLNRKPGSVACYHTYDPVLMVAVAVPERPARVSSGPVRVFPACMQHMAITVDNSSGATEPVTHGRTSRHITNDCTSRLIICHCSNELHLT
ncbi:hypothetical protein BD309DRAFT_953134 [Dichomitus squalens]|uniref:uncharacterized protein n=1 Tax=Dichomitus squalens (strain LYAD-421) TaxID=732165 RepID=UPI0004412279|nr:uncharacterized protein DICSQDRAFT_132471 [Dichomitus squalens LYAD-421 SS1]EJF66341.1 hypothetical protein DICSQDRAFT_132471 [Dichomitus squalens LYAD-421 SS1]TBU46883.1 hypothetical protein BD309DRAFT_953134 [Dichomitus squalens]